MYQNLKYDLIKPLLLDQFLGSGKIAMFRRTSGWVFVGIDPIRKTSNQTIEYQCPYSDRRKAWRRDCNES